MQQRKNNYKFYFLYLLIIVFIFQGVLLKKYFLWGGDLSYQAFPLQKYFFQEIKNGNFTCWNPYVFLGHPLLADPGSGVFYPFNLLYLFFSPETTIYLIIIFNFFFIAVTTFLLLQTLNFSLFTSFFITTCYTFSNLFLHIFGNPITLNALTFFPLSILLILKIINNNKLILYLVLSLILTLQIFSGEAEVLFYTLVSIIILWLFHLRKTKNILKSFVFIFLMLIFTLSIGLLQLFPSYELATFSLRSGDFKFKKEFFLKEIPKPQYLLLWPAIYFDKSNPFIISVKNPAYSDLFLFLLFPLTFFVKKNKITNFFLCLFFISLIITFFNPFVFFVYQKLPVLKMLRMPIKFTLTATYLSITILAAYTLKIITTKKIPLTVFSKVSFFILGWYLLEIIITSTKLNYNNPGENLLNEGIPFVSLFILFYLSINFYLKGKILLTFFKYFSFSLICLSLLINPVWRIKNYPVENNNSTLCKINYQSILKTPLAVSLLKKDKNSFRIWDFPNTFTGHGNLGNKGINYKLYTVGGFSTVLSLRWVKFSQALLQENNKKTKENILSFLNVKYEIYSFPP